MSTSLEQAEAASSPVESKVPCSGLRLELLNCLKESECVTKYGETPRTCLQDSRPGYDPSCKALQVAFFECKRSLIIFREICTSFLDIETKRAEYPIKSSKCIYDERILLYELDNRQRFRGHKGY